MAHNPVHMAILNERTRMAVIRAQNEIPWVEPLLRDGSNLAFNVVPSAAKTKHGPHSLTHACNRIGLAGAFVIVRRSASGIGMKRRAKVGRGIVPANRFTRPLCLGDFSKHLCVARCHTRKVHHLSQANNARPTHGFGNILGRDLMPSGFQARRRRGAGRHLGVNVHRLHQRFVMHELYAAQT